MPRQRKFGWLILSQLLLFRTSEERLEKRPQAVVLEAASSQRCRLFEPAPHRSCDEYNIRLVRFLTAVASHAILLIINTEGSDCYVQRDLSAAFAS
jgi:hypothetical protein